MLAPLLISQREPLLHQSSSKGKVFHHEKNNLKFYEVSRLCTFKWTCLETIIIEWIIEYNEYILTSIRKLDEDRSIWTICITKKLCGNSTNIFNCWFFRSVNPFVINKFLYHRLFWDESENISLRDVLPLFEDAFIVYVEEISTQLNFQFFTELSLFSL